jgi:hypothetical protein
MFKDLIQNFRMAWKIPRWRWALLVALASDAVGFGVALLPPVQWSVDAVTAIALLAVLGFRWGLLGALAIEVVPVLQLFPAWTLVVAALASTEKQQVLPDPVTKVQKPPLTEINPPQKTKLTP